MFQSGHAVDEVFDYASFMWDYGDFWQQASPDIHQNQGLEAPILVSLTIIAESVITLQEFTDAK